MNRIVSPSKSTVRQWLPVVGLSFAAFIFNTSEFVPIGLLSDIARDFGITESHAGLLITVYAWFVAMASLPLMLLVSRMEYRKLLLGLFALFIASHIASACASSYYMLMASRIGVASAHAVFWSIVSPLAVKVAPEGHRSAALGIVITGSSIAMIAGLPLGRTIGLLAGWRMTFFYIGVAATIIMLFITAVFPKVCSDNAVSLRSVPSMLRRPALMSIYLLTLVLITAQFTAYSYIEPFLGQVAQMSEGAITLILTLFGAVGIIGSVIFSRCYDRHPNRFIRFAVIGIAASLALLYPAAATHGTVIALCTFWGLSITFFNLVFQAQIIRVAPQSTAIAMAVYSGIYNVGIGSGALVGGMVCADLSVEYIGFVGCAIAIVAAAFCLTKLLPILRRENI